MFSKTLIKLIDAAIFPAVFIIAAKILAVAFLSKYFDASYSVQGLKLEFHNAEDFIAINSYSSLIMFAAVFAGLVWVVFKAHVLHDTHVKPALSAKLLEMNMIQMVHKTDVIFSETFVWLSYAWLTSLIIGGYALYGFGYWWVFYISFAVTVVTSAAMALDFEREVSSSSKPFVKVDGHNDVEISMGGSRLLKISDLSREIS